MDKVDKGVPIFEDFLVPGEKGLVVFRFEIQETKQLDLRRVLRFFDIARIRQAGPFEGPFSGLCRLSSKVLTRIRARFS
jgi:hypothetical protein